MIKQITPEMIEIGYQQLPKFNNAIKKIVKKFVKEIYSYDDGFGMADLVMEKVLEKFPDNSALLQDYKALATYEFLFNCFNTPQELIAIHEQELSLTGRYYSDAYIRIMIKDKKIWIENWISCDELPDNYYNSDCGYTKYYSYNQSIGIDEMKRQKLYGDKIVNLYNVDTLQYSFNEEIID